ncbi:hypothetical protein [Ramlibacter sp.]|uniref:hypothetical protein n=1 Tax=Ramlibacter sp. TaxID=1917967 RepID=UPI00261108BF|nr:hypothetical protein [Ramlibacter sp.]
MSAINTSSRCACGIDAHAHVVPENFPKHAGAAMPVDWPSMVAAAGFDEATVQRLVHRNAERFLGLTKETTP